MRTASKYRISFLLMALSCYSAGFWLLPNQLDSMYHKNITAAFAGIYFVLLPLLYWLMIIRAGGQKPWKLLLIFSLSAGIARFSFPAEIADYFTFIAWLKYPIIGILLLLELALFWHVIKGLWQARKLKGDPRVHTIIRTKNDDEKKQQISISMAYEPASWYYALPFLSKNHVPVLGHIMLMSAKRWHFCIALLCIISASYFSYTLIAPASELVALIVSSFIGYTLVMFSANYRISRHYSLYIHQNHLIINESIFGLMVVPLINISATDFGDWARVDKPEAHFLGRGEHANLKLVFSQQQTYSTWMGMVAEPTHEVYLCLDGQTTDLESVAAKIRSGQIN